MHALSSTPNDIKNVKISASCTTDFFMCVLVYWRLSSGYGVANNRIGTSHQVHIHSARWHDDHDEDMAPSFILLRRGIQSG